MIDRIALDRLSATDPLDQSIAEGAARVVVRCVPGRVKSIISIFLPVGERTPRVIETIDLLNDAARRRLLAQLPEDLRDDCHTTLRSMASNLASQAHVAPANENTASELVQRAVPWHQSVEPCDVLGEVQRAFNKYVVLPAHGDVVAALWVLHSHLLAAFDYTPYLWLSSPTKQCGKTRILEP